MCLRIPPASPILNGHLSNALVYVSLRSTGANGGWETLGGCRIVFLCAEMKFSKIDFRPPPFRAMARIPLWSVFETRRPISWIL